MPTYRTLRSLIVVAALGAALLALPAAAQTVIPNLSYVRDSNGQVFIVTGGTRVGVTVFPATDDEIAAIPFSGQWITQAGDPTATQPASSAPVAVAVQPTAVPADTGAAIKLRGDTSKNTPPFTLAAGSYVATFKTELRAGGSSCFTSASLNRVADKRTVERIYSTTLNRQDGRTAVTGETRLYGVVAGEYYLDVQETGCSWSVEIRPA